MTACIYAIVHVATGDTYIGATTQPGLRWTYHRRDLRAGKHSSTRLQAAWDAFGEAAFEVKRLLVCRAQDWRMYEADLIRALRPVFNTAFNTSVRETSRRQGVANSTVSVRMLRGMTLEEALATPVVPRQSFIQQHGMTLPQLCEKHGVKHATVKWRLRQGQTLEQALTPK
jgi:hypothetical protein